MKKYSIIILVLLSSTIFSQSLTDSLILNKINEYRLENNLEILKFTELGYKAAKHHNEYLNKHPEVGVVHKENNNTPFQYERLKKYNNLNNKIWISAENIFAIFDISSKFKLNTNSRCEYIANRTIEAWKKSEGHNQNLLLKTTKYVGINTMITKDNKIIVTYVTYSFS